MTTHIRESRCRWYAEHPAGYQLHSDPMTLAQAIEWARCYRHRNLRPDVETLEIPEVK